MTNDYISADLLKSGLRRLLTAIAFLTRIPVSPSLPFDGDDVARSTVFFPLVGGLIGALQIALLLVLGFFVVPLVLQAFLATALLILLCGGLHQDGLADMADGFGGAYKREDVLRIMRDSTIGTYGGLALILSIGLRVSAITLLAASLSGLLWIAAAAILARCSICLAWKLPYARASGTGASISSLTGANEVCGAVLIALILSLLLLGTQALAAIVLCAFVFTAMAWLCMRKIGGITGDTLGATTEVCEVLLLTLGASLVSRMT